MAISSGPAVTTNAPMWSVTPAIGGRDEVGDRQVRLAVAPPQLLAQAVQAGDGTVCGEDDVVAVAMRRPEPDDRLRREPLPGDDLFEHPLRVVEQRPRSIAELGVVEDRRVAAAQAPRVEERRPVDVRHELGDVDVVERRARR